MLGAPPSTTEGIVHRLQEGWPTMTLTKPALPTPTGLQMRMFDEATNAIRKIGAVFGESMQSEFDIDLFFGFMNRALRHMTFLNNGQ